MNASSVKAAVYVRQSKDQEEGILRGLAGTRRLVEQRGWSLVGEYSDNAVSASKDRKEGTDWARMLEDIRAGRVNAVVGIDMDRLLRRVVDVLILIDLGVLIVTLDGDLDTSTAEGRRRAVDQANGAQFEAERKGERQKRSNEAKRNKADGAVPVPGRRRFGFQKGNREPDPVEAPLVLWAYDEILNGASVYSIAKELGRGVDFTRGMLRNPAYAGWLTRGTYERGRRVSMERFEAAPSVSRLVDRERFEKVQAVLDAKGPTPPGNKANHLLSGLIICDVCEGRMVHSVNGYRCVIGHVTMKTEQADPLAVEELLYALREPEESELGDSPELAALVLAEAELERQRTAAQEIALMPGANLQHLGKELARIATELERVSNERRGLRRRTARAELAASVMEAWNFDGWEQDALDGWYTYFNALPLDQRRELVRDNLDLRLCQGRELTRLKVSVKEG